MGNYEVADVAGYEGIAATIADYLQGILAKKGDLPPRPPEARAAAALELLQTISETVAWEVRVAHRGPWKHGAAADVRELLPRHYTSAKVAQKNIEEYIRSFEKIKADGPRAAVRVEHIGWLKQFFVNVANQGREEVHTAMGRDEFFRAGAGTRLFPAPSGI